MLASAETALGTFGMAQFYEKRVRDYVDAQLTTGGLTETAPFVGISTNGLGGDRYLRATSVASTL